MLAVELGFRDFFRKKNSQKFYFFVPQDSLRGFFSHLLIEVVYGDVLNAELEEFAHVVDQGEEEDRKHEGPSGVDTPE